MSKQQHHDDQCAAGSSNRGHHTHRHHDDRGPDSSNRGHHKQRHHDDQSLGNSSHGHHKHRHHDDHDEDGSVNNTKASTKPPSPHKGHHHHHHHHHHHRNNEASSPKAEPSPSRSMYDGHRSKVSTISPEPSPNSRSMHDGHRKVSTIPESPKTKGTHDETSIKAPLSSRENQQETRSVRSDKQISSIKTQSKGERNAAKMADRQHQTPSLMERLFSHNKQHIVLKTQPAIDAVMTFGLTDNHLQRLRHSFDVLDKDKSESIDRQEFMNDIGERSSPYTDKLFRLIDSDDHGSFDFEQYVRVISSYCMFSKTQILHFCFECFDPMNSGYIDEEGFVSLCKYVNNSPPGFPQNFRAALKEFDENLDGYIDFKEFSEFERRFPVALFPAFRLQDAMQRMSLGNQTWLDIMKQLARKREDENYMKQHGRPPPARWLRWLFL